VKSTLKRRSKELEIVKREAYEAIDWGREHRSSASDGERLTPFAFSRRYGRGAFAGRLAGIRRLALDRVPTWDRGVSEGVGFKVLGRRRSRRRSRLIGSRSGWPKARGSRKIETESSSRGGGDRGCSARRGLEAGVVREIGGFRGRVGRRAFAAFRESLAKRLRSTRLGTRTKESNMYASFIGFF